MDLSRLAWLTTTSVCFVAALVLLFDGYFGYAGCLVAVGLAAAINLR